MKKLFYFLTTIAIMLSGCSSNDESVAPAPIDNNTKYPINFSVSGFKLNAVPLKRSAIGIYDYYLQHVFYKEDGTVYETERKKVDSPTAKNIVLNRELPVGKYHVALILMTYYNEEWEPSIFTPINLNTDLIMAQKTYYQLITIDVTPNGVSEDVTLEPMWSTLDIKFSDAATCYIPEGTSAIQAVLTESALQFYAKDKEPRVMPEWPHQWIDIGPIYPHEFRKLSGFTGHLIGAINHTSVQIRFHGSTPITPSNPTGSGVIYIRTLHEGKLERGKHYTLEGELGTPNAESGIKITVTKLEDVTLPFDK